MVKYMMEVRKFVGYDSYYKVEQIDYKKPD